MFIETEYGAKNWMNTKNNTSTVNQDDTHKCTFPGEVNTSSGESSIACIWAFVRVYVCYNERGVYFNLIAVL